VTGIVTITMAAMSRISTDGSGREHPTLQEVGVLHAFIVWPEFSGLLVRV